MSDDYDYVEYDDGILHIATPGMTCRFHARHYAKVQHARWNWNSFLTPEDQVALRHSTPLVRPLQQRLFPFTP